jgi:hypothetical protein
MRSAKSVARKAAKEKARRADYAKRRNVKNNNWPTPRYLAETDVMGPDGKGGLVVVGKRREWKKYRIGARIAAYDADLAKKGKRATWGPKSRKFRRSKRQEAEEQGTIRKIISKVTAGN